MQVHFTAVLQIDKAIFRECEHLHQAFSSRQTWKAASMAGGSSMDTATGRNDGKVQLK